MYWLLASAGCPSLTFILLLAISFLSFYDYDPKPFLLNFSLAQQDYCVVALGHRLSVSALRAMGRSASASSHAKPAGASARVVSSRTLATASSSSTQMRQSRRAIAGQPKVQMWRHFSPLADPIVGDVSAGGVIAGATDCPRSHDGVKDECVETSRSGSVVLVPRDKKKYVTTNNSEFEGRPPIRLVPAPQACSSKLNHSPGCVDHGGNESPDRSIDRTAASSCCVAGDVGAKHNRKRKRQRGCRGGRGRSKRAAAEVHAKDCVGCQSPANTAAYGSPVAAACSRRPQWSPRLAPQLLVGLISLQPSILSAEVKERSSNAASSRPDPRQQISLRSASSSCASPPGRADEPAETTSSPTPPAACIGCSARRARVAMGAGCC